MSIIHVNQIKNHISRLFDGKIDMSDVGKKRLITIINSSRVHLPLTQFITYPVQIRQMLPNPLQMVVTTMALMLYFITNLKDDFILSNLSGSMMAVVNLRMVI